MTATTIAGLALVVAGTLAALWPAVMPVTNPPLWTWRGLGVVAVGILLLAI